MPITTKATLTIYARDDNQADAVYNAIHEALKERGLQRTWPNTPVVNIMETEREAVNG